MPALATALLVPVLFAAAPAEGRATVAQVPRAPDVAVVTTPEPAAPRRCVSDADVAAARRYAQGRGGSVSFAVFERGTLRSWQGSVRYRSASLVKAMLLVAELRRQAANGTPLTAADRGRLAAMIRVSDNAAASRTFEGLGSQALRSVARLAGMRNYDVGGYWGTSRLTASDQARLWGRLDRFLPARYRAFGRGLLRTISHAQVWGGAPVARRHGFRTLFKSGWLPQPGGWLVHQGLRLERGSCTVGIAVLTGGQPSMAAGVDAIRGVTARLLGAR